MSVNLTASTSHVTTPNTEVTHRQLDARLFNLLLLATQVIAYWPVWEWYALRMIRYPENRVGMLALVSVVLIAIINSNSAVTRAKFTLPVVCLLLYAAVQSYVHPLAACIIAAVSIGYTAGHFFARNNRLPVIGLVLLSLPVIPSMQTYIGYPLRILIAELAAPFAHMSGVTEAVREGVGLRWSGGIVLVDEPCSGIRMLWTGSFIALTMAGILGLSNVRVLLLCIATLGLVVVGNLFRTLTLFIAEVHRQPMEGALHSFVGLFWFGLAGVMIVLTALRLIRNQKLS